MQRHGFGRGEYQYFRYPLPALVQPLRTRAVRVAGADRQSLERSARSDARYPADAARIPEAVPRGRTEQPTPLLLRYDAGDYNCLHQDLYGEQVFPLQATVLLSAPGEDFEGGEFALTEQRPRAQSRAEVVSLRQGDAVIFPVHHRPVQGAAEFIESTCATGSVDCVMASDITLGMIFHDGVILMAGSSDARARPAHDLVTRAAAAARSPRAIGPQAVLLPQFAAAEAAALCAQVQGPGCTNHGATCRLRAASACRSR